MKSYETKNSKTGQIGTWSQGEIDQYGEKDLAKKM
jgi:hypothetical protein